ncbi:MAG TPA: hypothetical protein VGV59_15300 [Pyrinomonadaceae bacterium]|nr:hypothetical protein [Pyrinomonadaceae bacterium]
MSVLRVPRVAQTNLISRRDLLKASGAVFSVLSPATGALGAALQGPFEFVNGDGHAIFKLGGQERWVIDVARFGGRPRLKVERDAHLIRLELADALFPGTSLSADMACEIHRRLGGWHMKLRLATGEFACEVPFDEWLNGAATARAQVRLDAHACELGERGSFDIAGAARAEFSPAWLLTLSGSGVGRVSGLGAEILSDAVSVSLLAPAQASLMSRPAAKRTLISLKRVGRSWPLEPAMKAADGWKLTTTDRSFDVIHLEAGESADGLRAAALLAESQEGVGTLTFHPSADLTDADGEPFALRLRAPRYAVAFDPAGDQTALVARFDDEPVRLRHRGISLQLGDAPEVPPFELTCRGERVESLRCSPALLSFAAPLQGAAVEPTQAAEGSLFSFELGGVGRARERRAPEAITPRGRLHFGARSEEQSDNLIQDLAGVPISVLRAEDLLALTFEFRNLSLVESASAGRKLQRTKPDETAFIIVRFPPQHIAEEVFGEAVPLGPIIGRHALPRFIVARFQSDKGGLEIPIRGRVAGESQLAFRVPDNVQEIPYTLASLLDWERFEPRIHPKALLPPPPPPELGIAEILSTIEGQPFPAGAPTEPLALNLLKDSPYTVIEAPYKLFLSPNEAAAWAHARKAVTHGERTELWHTRLGVRGTDGQAEAADHPDAVDERNDYYRTLRAILAFSKDDPFSLPLTPEQRAEMVSLTINTENSRARYIRARRLMLTTLGAWMDTHYAAEPPEGFNVEEWIHRATLGRDHYVRVVTKGFLFPFGHRASSITITERKFRQIGGGEQAGQVGAFLFKHTFIVVRQPLKRYGDRVLKASSGKFGDKSTNFAGEEVVQRMFPFRSVRLTTLITPELEVPVENEFIRVKEQGGQPFQFHMIAEDLEGRAVEFTAPLIFVPNSDALSASGASKAQSKYEGSGDARRRPLNGQKVAFAQSTDGQGATSFETSTITFDGFVSQQAAIPNMDEPAFVPVVTESGVRLQSVEQLVGGGAQTAIRYQDIYLREGFSASNAGEVFVKLSGGGVPLDFASKSDRAGGLATPNLNIDGLSRKFGPIANADALAVGQFNPATFFDTSRAKLLGGIGLHEIIASGFGDAKIPKLLNTVVRDVGGVPTANQTELLWEPPVQSDPLNFFQPQANGRLRLQATLVTPLDGREPTYAATGSMKDFRLSFFDLVLINFESFEFIARSGKKLDVSVILENPGAVTFGGPLSFLNVLAAVLPADGFSDPPSLDISPGGVTVGYTLALPSIEAGAWGFRDLSVSAGLTVPFTGDPARLRFAFGERQNPFQVIVYGVTGGGFFALHVGLGGIETVEAAFELGGSLGLNLGVASGALAVMIGIYMTLETSGANQNQVFLAGYVRLSGAVSVLGLVTVSVEFFLQLGYDFGSKKLRGEASMTVRVKVLFFSKKVTIRVEREFEPPVAPPVGQLQGEVETTLAHLSHEDAWERYCAAFA